TFLVRKCSSSQRKVLCLRATADKSASSVQECFISEEDSTFALESSALSFPDLCRLVAFYCISRDVLSLPLQLPDAIARAATHRQLEAISHMGQDFWSVPSASDIQNGLVDLCPAPGRPTSPHPPQNRHGKICFINPLFLQLEVKSKRNRFKRSMRLRISESSMNLSLEGVGSYSPSGSEDQEQTCVNAEPLQPQSGPAEDPGIEVTVQALERRPAPSLAELDSNSSFSSMDEDPDSDSDPETSSGAQSALHRMSEAFVCFFAPDKRLTRLVEELSRDRRSTFGGMVQDFLLAQRELLQGLRLFLSQAKCCLVDSGELEPPIETLVPENEKDLALERAMFSCVLRPLRGPLSRALAQLHSRDGSTQRLVQNLLRLKGDAAMERLGVRTGVPDSRGVERVKQKLALMQRTHSPIDKVLLLLQVCKCVHKSMGTLHGQDVSWDDFLPSLSYVIVECNRPHILMEVEYMMELLEPSWLGGEGGYYLTCVFASLCLIQKWDGERPPSGCLTQEAQEALKEWRQQELPHTRSMQRCVRILFQDGDRSAVRTLQWRAGESSQALAQLCAFHLRRVRPGA
uniref:Si:ch211-168d1.3 n=1 Tax=Tetraodon nigroviridis TaxID=99883 RepID=H3C4W5_TETNG